MSKFLKIRRCLLSILTVSLPLLFSSLAQAEVTGVTLKVGNSSGDRNYTDIYVYKGSKAYFRANCTVGGEHQDEDLRWSYDWDGNGTWDWSQDTPVGTTQHLTDHTYSTSGVYNNVKVGCYQMNRGSTRTATCEITVGDANITVSQSANLWYFSGVNPANYAIVVTLTANGVDTGTFKWDVVANGAPYYEVDFENDSKTITLTDDNTVGVKSLDSSANKEEVRITFTYNGAFVCEHTLTVYAPDSLQHLWDIHDDDATWGYDSQIHYKILDQFEATLPSNVEIGEKWTTDVSPDCDPMDWRRGDEGSATVGPSNWHDHIQGETSSHTPTPQNPQEPLGSDKVYHWGQAWYVGSLTIGSGRYVHGDTLQKYRDHARHE